MWYLKDSDYSFACSFLLIFTVRFDYLSKCSELPHENLSLCDYSYKLITSIKLLCGFGSFCETFSVA